MRDVFEFLDNTLNHLDDLQVSMQEAKDNLKDYHLNTSETHDLLKIFKAIDRLQKATDKFYPEGT